jgi:hypothetical protein
VREKQLADWILSPRAKERGLGCGTIISEARYAEMRHEIEEERRATDAAAKLLAEEVTFSSHPLVSCLPFSFVRPHWLYSPDAASHGRR